MGDYFSINNPNVDNSTGENYGVNFIKSDYYYNIEEIRSGTMQTAFHNNYEFFINFCHYYDIASSILKIKNVPSLYKSNLVLQILLQHDGVAICKRDDEFYIAPFFSDRATFNENGEPVEIELNPNFSLFGFNKIFSSVQKLENKKFKNTDEKKEFAVLRLTPSHLPIILVVYYYASKIYGVQKALDQNIFTLQQPLIFSATRDEKLGMTNIFKNFAQGVKAIFVKQQDNSNFDNVKILNTQAENNLNSFCEYKNYLKNEFYTFFGINSTPYEKKERLVTDEVKSNDMLLEIIQSAYYNTLADDIENCNKTLGTNIKIEWNVAGVLNTDKNVKILNTSTDKNLTV